MSATERRIYLDEDVPAIPDMAINDLPTGNPNGWRRIQLADDQYAIPPEPPAIQGLLYRKKRHVVSGPPESAKTMVIYALLLTALREGSRIAIIDFEMGSNAARILLDELGASRDEIRSIYYVEPDSPPTPGDIEALVDHETEYALIDAAAGAYDATGLDDNLRKDVERFARKWIKPLRERDIATIVIDHVAKNSETRGNWAIGSERKGGQADVHLGLQAVKTLTRGNTGLVKVTVQKDRPGFLDRPTACLVDLASDPDTHHVTVQFKPHDEADPETGEMRPTVLMEKVSRYLEIQHEPVSRTNIEEAKLGKSAEWVRKAIDALIREGWASEESGPRRSRLVKSERIYRQATDPRNEPQTVTSTPEAPDPVSPRLPHEQANRETLLDPETPHSGVTSAQNTDLTPSDSVSNRLDGLPHTPSVPVPSTEGRDGVGHDQTGSPRLDDIDEQDQALIDYYASLEHRDPEPIDEPTPTLLDEPESDDLPL